MTVTVEERNRLVEQNMPLARWYADRTYKRRQNLGFCGVEFADILQQVHVALIRSAEKYDPSKGAFSTYAIFWMRQMTQRQSATTMIGAKLPPNVMCQLKKLRNAERKSLSNHRFDWERREKLFEEYAALSVSPEMLRKARSLVQIERYSVSGDGTGFDRVLGDMLTVDHEWPDAKLDAKAELEAVMLRADLSDKERDILAMYYGLGGREPMTFREIGEVRGTTYQSAQQMHGRAMAKLQRVAGAKEAA